MNADKTDYDLLYNPRLVVKDYQAIFDRWEKDSERPVRTLTPIWTCPTARPKRRSWTSSLRTGKAARS